MYDKESGRDSKEVREIRKKLSMRTVHKGTKLCLRCDRPFESPDIIKIRICCSCRETFRSRYGFEDELLED